MGTAARSDQIVLLVEERGFVSVKELSTLHKVSEVTIRRDLQRLDDGNRLRRTHGGAVPLRATTSLLEVQPHQRPAPSLEGFSIFDKVDVLVATSCDPNSDKLLLDRMEQHGTPVIAESIKLPGMKTLVSVDNYQASRALGRWAGDYSRNHFDGRAVVLDLTYRLENTRVRSQGFMDGLKEILPDADMALSINAQSTQSTTYQLVKDALEVYPEISIIFAINDATAIGAIQACHDLGIDRDSLAILTFGMEGDTLKQALFSGEYCKAGVAMFPEIVGPVCVEAAIAAFNQEPMPKQLVTPFTILTPETLSEYYLSSESGWSIRWDTVMESLAIPLSIEPPTSRSAEKLPARIGFVVPFIEHEWYLNLIAAMQGQVEEAGILLEIVDFNQHLKEEVELKKRGIAERAAAQVQAEDVLLISSGQTTLYLAEELLGKESITVITNSLSVFDILRDNPGITLMLTGGVLRPFNNTLVGLIGEGSLKELRADKLFLGVAGVTLDFGLSDDPMTDVAMKQAMIKAAREVILLADHTKYGHEAVVQVASADVVDMLITDRALPASARLDFATKGIEVIVARV